MVKRSWRRNRMKAGVEFTVSSPALVEYVRLPDASRWPRQNEKVRFGAAGEKDSTGRTIIYVQGVTFIWVRFEMIVKAGQTATMVFDNIPGAWQLGGLATEWDDVTDTPRIGEAIISLIAIPRGIGMGGVVCRNTHQADHYVAAGLV